MYCQCSQVQFEGVRCSEPNVSYHVGFASVFLLVAATSLIQLFICIHAEYARMKAPSILKACRITNQKFLYILVFLAALLRGLYFAYPVRRLKINSNDKSRIEYFATISVVYRIAHNY